MNEIKLISPVDSLEKEYNEMLKEWHDSGEVLVPFVLRFDPSDFKQFVSMLDGFKNGIDIPETFVPHSTFWLVNPDNRILGVVNIRHRLTDKLLKVGGHIGYGIRPTERRKGFATKILLYALKEAKNLGISKALVTCSRENIASKKTILKSNGKFYREVFIDGENVQGYWIDVA